MAFWTAPSGAQITGAEDKSFVADFSTIPEGTSAVASIKKAEVVSKEATQYAGEQKFIEVTYKIVDGDYKNREVRQKIKCFDGTNDQVERNLNMLMLIMKLCDFKPTHNDEPTASELASLCGKIIGIVIGEWSLPKQDGTGNMEGNFVRECYKSEGFKCETGVKAEIKHAAPVSDSAMSRNKPDMDDGFMNDVPF